MRRCGGAIPGGACGGTRTLSRGDLAGRRADPPAAGYIRAAQFT